MSILRFGEKVLGKAHGALKFGEKVTGIADRVGHKVAARASSMIDAASPFIGSEAAGKARAVVGVVKSGADMAHTANKGVRGVETAAHAGNVNQALNIMRTTAKDEFAAGKRLKNQAKSTLERVRK